MSVREIVRRDGRPGMNWNSRLALVIFACGLWAEPTLAQRPSEPAIAWRERSLRLPFTLDPVQGARLREIRLHVSSDNGRTWPLYAAARPDQQFFTFAAQSDGEYWFQLRTVDHENREDPPTMVGLPPKMRVRIDTMPPQITLRGVNPAGDEIGVEWQVRDDDLDLSTMRIEFRGADESQWRRVQLEQPAASGQAYWRPGMRGRIVVGMRVSDRAGNEASQETIFGFASGIPAVGPRTDPLHTTSPTAPNANANTPYSNTAIPLVPDAARSQANSPFGQSLPVLPSPVNTRLVNATRFDIRYQPEGVGKSGLSAVSLYWTQDRDAVVWNLYGADDDRVSPMIVDVQTEGVYGFTLVARSGVGVGDDPPAPGDPPQVWVEVDLAAPDIAMSQPKPGHGPTEGQLFIEWQVTDRNLAQKPITLLYSKLRSGPWESIAANLDNIGRYQWRMPPEMPYQFFVQIEARDRAGNVGRQVTEQPVIIDLSRPRIKVVDVSANSSRGRDALTDSLPNLDALGLEKETPKSATPAKPNPVVTIPADKSQ